MSLEPSPLALRMFIFKRSKMNESRGHCSWPLHAAALRRLITEMHGE
jgi:hypothetical protein